jgi:hypothetical protein
MPAPGGTFRRILEPEQAEGTEKQRKGRIQSRSLMFSTPLSFLVANGHDQ